jgi:hypothetical protein
MCSIMEPRHHGPASTTGVGSDRRAPPLLASPPAMRVALLLTVLPGCPDRAISAIDPEPTKVESKDLPVDINRELDLLFLVDKSPTMGDEQAALAANFPRFIRSLSQIEGGLPSLHLGVISQDIGAGGFNVGGSSGNCAGDGDNGNLLATPRIPGCSPPDGSFISDLDLGGGNRRRNYTSSLEDTFSCIASLGPAGCGFEQHLGSLERALKGNPANAGFLRDGALLAIVIISDEDDCSASDPAIFDPGNAAVGPVADFRCFEWGWECDEGVMSRTRAGIYTNCRPRESSPYLYHPDHFVESIKRLKADPRQIVVSTIMGPSARTSPGVPFTSVDLNPGQASAPRVRPSCRLGDPGAADAQNAFPMPRLHHFAQQFPNRNSFFSLCQDDNNDQRADLERGLDLVAQLIKRAFPNPCFETDVDRTDLDPGNPGLQFECSVSDVTRTGTSMSTETVVPACKMADDTTPAADAAQPCWYVKPDPDHCSEFPTQLVFAVHPEGRTAPPGTHMTIQCVVE